jgi:hypothetical protein
MKRVLLVGLIGSALSTTLFAPPKKQAQDYSSWNDKWFVSNQGESFIVNVQVNNPKSGGSHTFRATFLPGSGICAIGSDAPQERVVFLSGNLTNGKISGTIFLCTTSQELADKNQLTAVFSRKFEASYDPSQADITDAIYKNEHYKREDSDTHGGSHSEPSQTPGPYHRDEPGDVDYGFEMHLFRGPAYDQVTPEPTPTPPGQKLGSKGKEMLDQVVNDGVHGWLDSFRKKLGAEPIH